MITRRLYQKKYNTGVLNGYRTSNGYSYLRTNKYYQTEDNWLALAIAVLANKSVNKALLLARNH